MLCACTLSVQDQVYCTWVSFAFAERLLHMQLRSVMGRKMNVIYMGKWIQLYTQTILYAVLYISRSACTKGHCRLPNICPLCYLWYIIHNECISLCSLALKSLMLINTKYIASLMLPTFTLQDGWTPLMYASLNNHPDVVDLLLKHHADINVQNKVISR